MTTTTELRARLAELEGERSRIFAELLPSARTGADRVVRWRDEDFAAWVCADVDAVRAQIVEHLTGFLVDDECRVALLSVPEIVALTDAEGFDPPRKFDLDYLAGEIGLTARYLAEVEGRCMGERAE